MTTTTQTKTFTTWQNAFQTHIAATYEGHTLKAIEQHTRVLAAWYQQAFQREFDPFTLTNYALKLYRTESLKTVLANTWNARRWALNILINWLGKPELMEGITDMESGAVSTKHRALTLVEYRWLNDAMEANILSAKTDEKRRLAIRDRALVTVMLQAGCRVAEATDLNWEDITINERSGEAIIRSGKGAKQRVVQLNKYVRAALKAWHEATPNAAAGAIFQGANGNERLTTRTAQRIVEELARQINVPDLTCHWLRYTAAKMCERHNHERGLSRSEVVRLCQLMLGHYSYDQTDRYLRSGTEERQSAMDWE